MKRRISSWIPLGALAAVCLLLWIFSPPAGVGESRGAELLVTEKPGEQVAGLTISGESGALARYARSRGLWRCLDAHGAIADPESIQALLKAAFEVRGTPVSATAPGSIPPGAVWRLELQGQKLLEREDRHVLLSLELLRRFESAGGGHALARNAAQPARVLDLDTDLARLAPPGPGGLPPLLDLRLCAGCFAPQFRYFQRFFFDYADGRSFEVRSTPRPDDPARLDWSLVSTEGSKPAIEWRAGGYGGIWIRARALGFAARKRLAELGLDPPLLTMVAQPDTGDALTIRVARLTPSREAWIYNENTGLVMQVEPELLALILAEPGMFTDATRPNPFERWLRK